MTKFLEVAHTLEDYWRSIILYGNNVASYKFALAKSLLEMAPTGKTFITLEELAVPFSCHLTEHLQNCDKQTTSPSSRFLNKCRDFNSGRISQDELINTTIRLGFVDVIDAFHNVNKDELPVRFFIDERRSVKKGIALTDKLLELIEGYQAGNLPYEVEARWRLVETSWQLNISRNLIAIRYDKGNGLLYTRTGRRINVTSCRDALNGYQDGKCFYCSADISIKQGSKNLTEVDHFFPHMLSLHKIAEPINGVWNLVLACWGCNNDKSNRMPALDYLKELNKRNEYLIESNHPLRETLILQTGQTETVRYRFLMDNYIAAVNGPLINTSWEPKFRNPPPF